MGWANQHIEDLNHGKTVQFRLEDPSMSGKIESGQLCTVEPVVTAMSLEKGDIVLCTVNGSPYLHLILTIQGPRYQIGDNRGHVNGWIGPNQIFGKCVQIEN